MARRDEYFFRDVFSVGDLPAGSERKWLRTGLTVLAVVNTLVVFGLGVGSLFGAIAGWIVAVGIAVPWGTLYFLTLPSGSAATEEPIRRHRLEWSWDRFARQARDKWYLLSIPLSGSLLVSTKMALRWDHFGPNQRSLAPAILSITFSVSSLFVLGMGVDFVETDEPWTMTSILPSKPRIWVRRSARRAGYVALFVAVPIFGLTVMLWLFNRFLQGALINPAYGQFGHSFVEVIRGLQGWAINRVAESSFSTFMGAKAWPVVFTAVFGITCGFWFFTNSLIWLVDTRISEILLVRRSLVPRNYLSFLDHAVQLCLIQRYGGGEYAFSHQLIRDHFIHSSESLLSNRGLVLAVQGFDRLIDRLSGSQPNAEDAPQHVDSAR
jgi:hypothetical protein